MVKFKFKITNETSIEDIEREFDDLCNTNANEIPLNHIVKLAKFLDVEYYGVDKGGSAVRFRHDIISNFGGYFTVHIKHKGGDEQLIKKTDYKAFLYKNFKQIITYKKQNK